MPDWKEEIRLREKEAQEQEKDIQAHIARASREANEREQRKFREYAPIDSEAELEQTEQMVPMSDGVRLRTIILRKKGAEAIPVLLQRSPYPYQEEGLLTQGREFALRGFAYVLQFCRGTSGSEGVWEPNVNERQDGIDTLRWLDRASWVENIGYFGASYLALTGWVLMDQLPEKVKGMYLSVYGTDRFVSAYQDGLFRQDILTAWAMGNVGTGIKADYRESCIYRPQTRVDRDLWGVDLPWYRDWITHTDRSDPYWQQGFWAMLREMPKAVRIPIVIEDGWYDHHLGSLLAGYRTMDEKGLSNSLLRIGAWQHMKQLQALGDRDCKNLESENLIPIYQFFKKILIDHEEPEHGVSLYEIGEDRWIRDSSWPENDGTLTLWFGKDEAGKKLSASLSEQEHEFVYDYDPEDPAPSWGAESCFRTVYAIGSRKQPEPDYRSDVLSFLSDPMEQDVHIVGQIKAKLYVSSDAEDTAFTVKVSEVFPDGSAYNIRSGLTTLAYRGHSDKRQSYQPGEVVPVEIDTWDVAWCVKEGSRIRVDISSSDFPQYSVHSNYPGIWSEQEKTNKAKQTIFSGGDHASALFIPFITSPKTGKE